MRNANYYDDPTIKLDREYFIAVGVSVIQVQKARVRQKRAQILDNKAKASWYKKAHVSTNDTGENWQRLTDKEFKQGSVAVQTVLAAKDQQIN